MEVGQLFEQVFGKHVILITADTVTWSCIDTTVFQAHLQEMPRFEGSLWMYALRKEDLEMAGLRFQWNGDKVVVICPPGTTPSWLYVADETTKKVNTDQCTMQVVLDTLAVKSNDTYA